MHDTMDWKAAMSSEIFREYLKDELAKQANKREEPPPSPENLDILLTDFKALESKINDNPQLRQAFVALRDKLASDPEYRGKVKKELVDGVMMLFLDEAGK